ncbi:MAG: hypothetical protein IKX40_07390 [Thermoguttaceae bacterium]|nr:hypothetical protein [Thermoguttaceae bacterium]
MFIPCKSCGQQLYIPDDVKELTVCCPACQKEFVYSAESMANENVKLTANSTDPVLEQTPQEEPLPEYATRESYHQPRILKLQPFSSMDALISVFRIVSQHFGAMILMFLVLALSNSVNFIAESVLVPNSGDLMNNFLEYKSIDDFSNQFWKIYNNTETYSSKSDLLLGISFLQFVVNAFLIIGCIRLFNAYGRNQNASLGLIFSGFDSPLRILIALFQLSFLIVLFLLLAFILLFMKASIIAIIFCIVFSIFFMVFLFFLFPLIADTNLSATKSFQLSCFIARRNILTLIGVLFLSLFIMSLIGYALLALLGSFIPLSYVSLICAPITELFFIGLTSVSYLKATGQVREL